MSAILMETPTDLRVGRPLGQHILQLPVKVPQCLVELGIWLGGIESFLCGGSGAAAVTDLHGAGASFGMINAALRRSAILASYTLTLVDTPRSSAEDLRRLMPVLRECVLLAETAKATDTAEWSAWARMLSERLTSLPEFRNIICTADREAERYLPGELIDLLGSNVAFSTEQIELALILPRFAKILRALKVVSDMLARDEPLKSSLLIFSRVYEQIADLTGYINNRLQRLLDEEAELFSSLDAASYTVAMELKKVYSQELAGISSIRPAPSVYARIETAYALLHNSFQQIITSLARVIDPSLALYDLFPELEVKRDRSIILRREIANLVRRVQETETAPETGRVDELRTALTSFQRGSSRELFFKDCETVERFVEEILVTTQDKDLVPILHRFGAYLETLFGQVNLRSVLANHPFVNA